MWLAFHATLLLRPAGCCCCWLGLLHWLHWCSDSSMTSIRRTPCVQALSGRHGQLTSWLNALTASMVARRSVPRHPNPRTKRCLFRAGPVQHVRSDWLTVASLASVAARVPGSANRVRRRARRKARWDWACCSTSDHWGAEAACEFCTHATSREWEARAAIVLQQLQQFVLHCIVLYDNDCQIDTFSELKPTDGGKKYKSFKYSFRSPAF